MKKKISQDFEPIEGLSTLRRTAFFLRLDLPSSLIRHWKTVLFESALQTRGIWKRWVLDEKYFENGAFRIYDLVTIINWFPCASFRQTAPKYFFLLVFFYYWGSREWVSILFKDMVRWWVYLAGDLSVLLYAHLPLGEICKLKKMY